MPLREQYFAVEFKLSAVLAFFALLLFSACGCENTDNYKGVTFKPASAVAEKFETSVYLLPVRLRDHSSPLVSNRSRSRMSILGTRWESVANVTVLIDGIRKLNFTEEGICSIKGIRGGLHTLSVVSSDDADRSTLFSIPFFIERKKMTLVILDLSDAKRDYRLCYQAVDSDYILKFHFRKLAKMYSEITALVEKYNRFVQSETAGTCWTDIFRENCRDPEGDISDRLMALRYRQGTEAGFLPSLTTFSICVKDDFSAVILAGGRSTGAADFMGRLQQNPELGQSRRVVDVYERLSVARQKAGETGKSNPLWKIAAIGVNSVQ